MYTTVDSSLSTRIVLDQYDSFQDTVANTILNRSDRNTTQMTTNNSYPFEYYIAMFAYQKFNFYGYYTINCFGIFTNLLVIAAAVCSQKLRKTSAGILITVLAHADLLTCTAGILVFTMYYNENLNIRPYCLITEYIWNTMRFFSHWIMVIIGFNRFALVCYPFKHTKVTSIKSTILQLITLFVFSGVAALYNIFGRDSGRVDCYLRSATDNLWIYYISTVVINYALGSFVPVTVTLCVTLLVYRALKRHQKVLNNMTKNIKTQQSENQVTKALVASNVSFIFLSVPYFSLYIPFFINGWLVSFPERVSYNMVTAFFILNVVECSNYVINIFLYTWYSPKFRQSLCGLFKVF